MKCKRCRVNHSQRMWKRGEEDEKAMRKDAAEVWAYQSGRGRTVVFPLMHRAFAHLPSTFFLPFIHLCDPSTCPGLKAPDSVAARRLAADTTD